MANSIFAINDELARLLAGLVNEETGEISADVEAQITALESAKTQKLMGCRNYWHTLQGQVDTAQAEIKRLAAYITHLNNVQAVIKRILQANVPEGEKIKDDSGRVVISWRGSETTEITDEPKVFDWCLKNLPGAIETPAPRLMKTAIKEYLKNTTLKIDGVETVKHNNILIK